MPIAVNRHHDTSTDPMRPEARSAAKRRATPAEELLPASHRRLLAPIRDVDERQRLAQIAFDEDLSKRALERLTREAIAEEGGTRRGRVALPAIVRCVRALSAHADELPPLTSAPLLPEATPRAHVELADQIEGLGRRLLRVAEHLRSQARGRR